MEQSSMVGVTFSLVLNYNPLTVVFCLVSLFFSGRENGAFACLFIIYICQ